VKFWIDNELGRRRWFLGCLLLELTTLTIILIQQSI